MPSLFSNVFSSEDLEYLTQLPEVIAAKAKLSASVSYDKVYFTIPVSETIRTALADRLGLDMSGISNIPMRWIKGDTSPHVDSGSRTFEHTYLVYLNTSPGDLILGNTSYPITANTAYVFNEGILHKTENTGTTPRLLLGPMSEFIDPVGMASTILYYTNYTDAHQQNGNYIAYQQITYILNDTPNLSGSIAPYTSWRVANVTGGTVPTGVYSNGFNLATLGVGASTFYIYPAAPCFLEGTKVLCQLDGVDAYVPIETVRCGTLVKTSRDGYKKVELIGKGTLANPGTEERIENRLYKCSPTNYPELADDLYITGCHSILVDSLSDVQREKTIKKLGRIFITDKKYRLNASIDERAVPWNSEGSYTIWHLALENTNPNFNYGIYVNGGLLVETCCINTLLNKSNMTTTNCL